jgi:teichuronic acid biosynthesis glycosyltransferase TuaG
MGVGFTRNRGISLAKGKYIAFLDGDDIWDKTKLEKQIEFMEEHKARISCTGSKFMDTYGHELDYTMSVPEKINFDLLLTKNLLSCSSVMAERQIFRHFRFPEQRMIAEDYALWLRMLEVIGLAYGLNEPLLTYRLSPKSRSSSRIKAAYMTFKAYQYTGRNIIDCVVLTLNYVKYSVSKRKSIHNS